MNVVEAKPNPFRLVTPFNRSGDASLRSFKEEPTGDRRRMAHAVQSDPDAALILAAGKGDMEAVGKLLSRHADRIFAIGYRMLGSAEAAEDLTQDVFFKIWKNAANWEPGRARFSTWLHRVALNLCYDRLRKRGESSVEELPEGKREAADTEDAATALERKVTRTKVREAVAKLPERQGAAIVLCHFEGYSNGEAADILETTIEAVESLLSRGRRRLKELLIDEKDEHFGGN